MSEQNLNPFLPRASRIRARQKLAEGMLGDAGKRVMRQVERGRGASSRGRVFASSDASDSSPAFELHPGEREDAESLKLRPGEFFLTEIPNLTHLPPEEQLTSEESDGYHFQDVVEELRGEQSLEDLKWKNIQYGYIGITDEQCKVLLDPPPFDPRKREIAKVLDIRTLIREVCARDPQHARGLSTQEVLIEMDRLGYRPASAIEILAFAKNFWKPESEADRGADIEERLLNASWVMALGGGVRVRESDGGVYSNAIGLFFSSKKGRSFAGAYAGMKWIEGFAFLMIRKDRDADLALTE